MACVTIVWMLLITLCVFGHFSLAISLAFQPLKDMEGINGISESRAMLRPSSREVDISQTSDPSSYQATRTSSRLYPRPRPMPRPPKPPRIPMRKVFWNRVVHRFEVTRWKLVKRARKVWKQLSKAWVKLDSRLQKFFDRRKTTPPTPPRWSTATTLQAMSRYVLNYERGEGLKHDPFTRLKILWLMQNLLVKTRPQRSKVQQLFRKYSPHPRPRTLEERPKKRIRLLPNEKSQTLKEPQVQQLKPVDPDVALEPKSLVNTRHPLGKEDLDFAKADNLAQNSIKVHDKLPISRFRLVKTRNKKKVLKLKPGLRSHNRIAGGKGASIAPPNGNTLPLSAEMKKWFPMRRLGGFRWSWNKASKLDNAKFSQVKKVSHGGVLSDDIESKALRDSKALDGISEADVATASSHKRLTAVDMSVIVKQMKRSKAEHTEHLVRMLETDKSLEGKADIFTTFFGPQVLKRLEESPEQQVQVVDVLYWMAYSGSTTAHDALRNKFKAGGLEKSVEVRTNQALQLLDEREANRESMVSDFANAGPLVSVKKLEVQDRLKQKLHDFSSSFTFGQTADVARDVITQAFCRVFVPETKRICRQVSRNWEQSLDEFRQKSVSGVRPHRRFNLSP